MTVIYVIIFLTEVLGNIAVCLVIVMSLKYLRQFLTALKNFLGLYKPEMRYQTLG